MRSKKFFVFLVVVILVVGYAVYDFQSDKRQESAKAEKALMFSGKADQVQKLHFENAKGEFTLVRTAEGWKFESPIQETADQDNVTQFIEGIAAEKSTAAVGGEGSLDLKLYGLEPQKASVQLTDNLGAQTKFEISEKKNFQGDSYVRRNGENQVLIAGSSWLQKSDKVIDDFRDRRWARINVADVMEVIVTKGTEKFTLGKKDADWIFTAKPNLKLDQNKVRKFISGVSVNRLQNFSMKPDSKPMMMIEFKLKDNRNWIGEFAVNKDKKHVLTIAGSTIYGEILPDDAKEIYNLSLDALRDRTEPFQVRREDVKKVEIETPLKKLSLEQKSEKWELVAGSDNSMQVDSDKMKMFLGKISNLELAEFNPKEKIDKLKSAGSKIILKSSEGKVIFELVWGAPHKVLQGGLERAHYLAKSSLYPDVFTMDEEKIKELGMEQILVDKKTEKPQNKTEVTK